MNVHGVRLRSLSSRAKTERKIPSLFQRIDAVLLWASCTRSLRFMHTDSVLPGNIGSDCLCCLRIISEFHLRKSACGTPQKCRRTAVKLTSLLRNFYIYVLSFRCVVSAFKSGVLSLSVFRWISHKWGFFSEASHLLNVSRRVQDRTRRRQVEGNIFEGFLIYFMGNKSVFLLPKLPKRNRDVSSSSINDRKGEGLHFSYDPTWRKWVAMTHLSLTLFMAFLFILLSYWFFEPLSLVLKVF